LRHLLTDNAFHVSRNRPETPAVDLRIVRRAIREQFKLRLAYRDPKGNETLRIIWPIMLGFIESKRFVADRTLIAQGCALR
jgi:predicted DNA-binding transcriptional regulator YafY